jgi:preprotein translocase subunit SecA
MGEARMRELEKFIMLRTLDIIWMDHLETMDSLRDSVRLRAYGQKDPLVEYKREGLAMFEKLLVAWQTQVVLTVFKVELKEAPQTPKEQNAPSPKTIGRNDSCFCGSGKKYKKCHGA